MNRPYQRACRSTPTSNRAPLEVEALADRVLPAGILAVGTDAGIIATVRTFTDADGNGTYETLAGELNPFGGFTGGVRVAMGDLDGNGNDELVTVMGKGGGRVKVWAMNSDGSVGSQRESFLPFGAVFKGGFFVAVGDLGPTARRNWPSRRVRPETPWDLFGHGQRWKGVG